MRILNPFEVLSNLLSYAISFFRTDYDLGILDYDELKAYDGVVAGKYVSAFSGSDPTSFSKTGIGKCRVTARLFSFANDLQSSEIEKEAREQGFVSGDIIDVLMLRMKYPRACMGYSVAALGAKKYFRMGGESYVIAVSGNLESGRFGLQFLPYASRWSAGNRFLMVKREKVN